MTFWTHTERGEPKRVLEVINQHFLPLLALARQQLQAGIIKGQVAPCDPDALIDLVACIIDGSLVHRITRGIEFAGQGPPRAHGARSTQAEPGAGTMNRNAYPLAIFTLRGDEAAMGRQHGGLARELGDWQATNAFYADMPGYLFGAGRRDRGRALLVKAIRPRSCATAWPGSKRARPDALRARTNGFLAALGRPADESRLLFVLDATQNVIGIMGRLGLMHQVQRLAAPGACSSFAVWGAASEDGRLLHARNFDLHGIGIWERTPTVVFCAPERGLRYGFVATRGADVPGVTAFNETGIVVAAHTRFHREVTFDGLGVIDLGHLIASRATSLADAVAIASEQRIASSWGIVVSRRASARRSSSRRTRAVSAFTARTLVPNISPSPTATACR